MKLQKSNFIRVKVRHPSNHDGADIKLINVNEILAVIEIENCCNIHFRNGCISVCNVFNDLKNAIKSFKSSNRFSEYVAYKNPTLNDPKGLLIDLSSVCYINVIPISLKSGWYNYYVYFKDSNKYSLCFRLKEDINGQNTF